MDVDTAEYVVEPDPEFAHLMHLAAPRVTPSGNKLADDLRTMALATAAERRRRSRRARGVAAAVLAPLLVLGGAGAAYASSNSNWSWFWQGTSKTEWTDWTQHPDAIITYTLPGGGSCELRLGQFKYSPDPNRPANVSADPRSLDAALDYLHSADVMADADVKGVVQENRGDQNSAEDAEGNQVPFGYGTDNYDSDVEYNTAVQEAIFDHLDTLGIPSTGLGYQGEQHCAGVTR